jgi:hypothetical protein
VFIKAAKAYLEKTKVAVNTAEIKPSEDEEIPF